MSDRNPTENLDAEGMPGELFDHPPGIDVETDSEGLMAPRDHSIAAGSDPAYPITEEENRRPESVADRADRELPEVGELASRDERDELVMVGSGGLLEPDRLERGGDVVDDEDEEITLIEEAEGLEHSLSPEEAAMHVTSEDEADDLDPAMERAEYLEGR